MPSSLPSTHGELVPPELTLKDAWTVWSIPPGVAVCLLLLLLGYGYLTLRLRRSGTAWPLRRLVYWAVGLAMILVGTSSAVGVYDTTLFSAHALQHMFLQMLAPVPLALASPVMLLLRALRPTYAGPAQCAGPND